LLLDHIQERLTPILQAVQKNSPSIDRLGAWLNPGNILQVNIRGPGFLQLALQNAPKFFFDSADCPRACFLSSACLQQLKKKHKFG
jgi:hypothetical protein